MIKWSTRRPAVVLATSAAILLAGAVSFARLPLATRTTVELPRLQIAAQWPGASAELVETYLTSPIEAAIEGVRGVRRTSSESRDEDASLTVELEPRANVQMTRLAILERLELLRPEFPPGVQQPRVSNYVPEALEEQPLMRFTVSGPYTPGALQRIADERLTPRLGAVPGVAGIAVRGGTDLGASITYDARRLRQLGIDPSVLADALRSARMVQALGEERMGASRREVVLRDQPDALEQLAALPIRGAAGRVFRLGELATVRPEEDARGRFFRVNGQPALALEVSRLPGADAIQTAAAARRTLDELRPTLPHGVGVRVGSDESVALSRDLRNLFLRGLVAFAAVLVVLALTLRRAKAVALVMGSAAVSIGGTALCLYLLGVPVNMLTLAGLAMGIGVLVQNGLVVVERLGTTPDTVDGRAEAGRRILPAVVGATLTTGVVLLPFVYLQGDARAAFFPFAAAFALALAWSVAAAVVMVPALGARHGVHETHSRRARRMYRRLLVPLVRRRWATIAVSTLVLAWLSWGFATRVPRFSWGSFGGGDRTTLQMSLGFPRGSDPETLDREMRQFERIVVGHPEVEQVVAQSWGPAGAGMLVLFTEDGQYTGRPQQLEQELTQRAVFVGGAQISVRGQGPGFSSGGGIVSSASFRIRVLGYSYSEVERISLDLKRRLEAISRVRNVNVNAASFFGQERAYAVTLTPDRAALARHGLTATQFRDAVSREIRGQVGRQLMEIGDEELSVTVKASGALDRTLEDLRESIVPNLAGSPVRIGDLAEVREREALSTITREDQQYVRVVSYEFRGPTKLANRTHESFMRSIDPPPGFSVADASRGWGPPPDESERGLWLVLAIGVVLVVLSVAMVFDSVWASVMVFLSLPLALAGVMAAFWMTKAAFTREAAVGVILVVGLAVNQSILLVDAALERRRASGRLGARAVLSAAVDRGWMIVLVTLTSIASLIPLAVGTGTGTQFGAIALATAGGTVAGTIGALVVLPAMLVDGRERRPRRAVDPAVSAAATA